MKTDLKIGIGVGVVVVVAAMFWIVERNKKPAATPGTVPPISRVLETPPATVPAPAAAPAPVAETVKPAPTVTTPPPAVVPPKPATPPVAVVPVPKPAAPEEPARPEKRYHVVQKGESLSSISEQYYGNGKFWKVIQQANQQILPNNSDKIRPGMRLRIPYPEEIQNQNP